MHSQLVQEQAQTAHYRDLVTRNGEELRRVPFAERTAELCLLAVQQNGGAIQFVPDHLIGDALCRMAVEQTAYAIKALPFDRITTDLCVMALKYDPWLWFEIPTLLRDRDKALIAVSGSPFIIGALPASVLDADLCLEAVRRIGRAIQNVPKQYLPHVIDRILASPLTEEQACDVLCGFVLRGDDEHVRLLLRAIPTLTEEMIVARLRQISVEDDVDLSDDPCFELLSRLYREVQLEAAAVPVAGKSCRPRL